MVRAIWDGTEASRWPCQLSDCVLTAECTSSNVTSGCMQLKKGKKKVLEMLPCYVRVRETDKTSIKFTSKIVFIQCKSCSCFRYLSHYCWKWQLNTLYLHFSKPERGGRVELWNQSDSGCVSCQVLKEKNTTVQPMPDTCIFKIYSIT